MRAVAGAKTKSQSIRLVRLRPPVQRKGDEKHQLVISHGKE